MALQGPIPVDFGHVFPDGVYAAGVFEPVRDFDASSNGRFVQSKDKASGLPLREEIGVDCCHANQDKFWVRDPDGVEWEVYYLNYDLEDETPKAHATALPLAKDAACCAPSVLRPELVTEVRCER